MLTKAAQAYFERMLPGKDPFLLETDPEFAETFLNFTLDEVAGSSEIDDKTRFIAILAALMGTQSIEAFTHLMPAAMQFGVKPAEIKEMVYQGVVYLGFGRILPFLNATNTVFKSLGIELPLESQKRTTPIERLEDGVEKQVEIFGEEKRDFYKSGEKTRKKINYWVSANAYGEYYTRGGLDTKMRSMITFCFLTGQGGCETQLRTHIEGNLHLGNDEKFLGAVLIQILPYIGYPRTFNALTCLEEVVSREK